MAIPTAIPAVRTTGSIATSLAGDYYRHCNACPKCTFHAPPTDCPEGQHLHARWWETELAS